MRITVYDGAETIGGNKIFVEENGRGVFLDFGMNFARYGQYFAEFITERGVRGIHDLIHLDLIPELNIYRSDVIPSDLDVSSYPKLNVDAVLFSHAHIDHCGNAGLLDERIPFIASPTTSAIVKAMRDVSATKLASEVAYHTVRAEEDRVLKSARGEPYRGRDFYVTSVPDDLAGFMCSRPGQDGRNAKKLDPGCLDHVCECNIPFRVRAYEVDHSIYGATGYVLEGDSTVAYSGDLRLHGRHGYKTRSFVKNAKDASILIIEGTRTSREEDYHDSEEIVFQKCFDAVEESDGLVAADFSPRNFERLEMFREIANKVGRKLVVNAKDAYMLHAIECADGVCRMDDVLIYGELKGKTDKWEEAVEARWSDAYVDPTEIAKNPQQYILCFSLYNLKHLLDIKPQKGTYVYSSSEAFTEEQEFDFLRLHNWLSRFNFSTCGFGIEKGKPYFEEGYHASGHVSADELRQIIEEVDPDVLIPVHTENPGWFADNFDNAVIFRNGESRDV
ncbi:MAG: MBL fold metallo-hydrolase [Archaeoglobaceae archaeon]